MTKGRLEAFSDAVIAIAITIMVLELRAPHAGDWTALRSLLSPFLSYVLSFIFLGIYWNNHHHLLHATERINGAILWANLHILFWLSLVPFATRWMGETGLAALPTAIYGSVQLLAAIGWIILQNSIIAEQGPDSKLHKAFGKDRKGKISIFAYALAVPLAFARPIIAVALYVFVAAMWLIPDRRIETRLRQ